MILFYTFNTAVVIACWHGPPAGFGRLSWPALHVRGGATPASTSGKDGLRLFWNAFGSGGDAEEKRRREQEEIAATREAQRKAREDRLERDLEDREAGADDDERDGDSTLVSLAAAGESAWFHVWPHVLSLPTGGE